MYSLGTGADEGKVLLTQAGLNLVNRGEDLPAFTLTPSDSLLATGASVTVDPSVMTLNIVKQANFEKVAATTTATGRVAIYGI